MSKKASKQKKAAKNRTPTKAASEGRNRQLTILVSICAVVFVAAVIFAFTTQGSARGGQNGARTALEANNTNDVDNDIAEVITVIDIDLTAMSDTMVYAALLNIMRTPDNHLGRTIRISGTYQSFFWDITGLHYHYIIVEGQAGCCPQRMEFRRHGNYVFPDDYPAEGAMIELVGVFGRYQEEGMFWYFLAVDEFIILQ